MLPDGGKVWLDRTSKSQWLWAVCFYPVTTSFIGSQEEIFCGQAGRFYPKLAAMFITFGSRYVYGLSRHRSVCIQNDQFYLRSLEWVHLWYLQLCRKLPISCGRGLDGKGLFISFRVGLYLDQPVVQLHCNVKTRMSDNLLFCAASMASEPKSLTGFIVSYPILPQITPDHARVARKPCMPT